MSLERQKISSFDFVSLCNELHHSILQVIDDPSLDGLTQGAKEAFIKSFIDEHKKVMARFDVKGLVKPELPEPATLPQIKTFISDCVQYRVDCLNMLQAKEKADSIVALIGEFNDVIVSIERTNNMLDRVSTRKIEDGEGIGKAKRDIEGVGESLTSVESRLESFIIRFTRTVESMSNLEKPQMESFISRMQENLNIIKGDIEDDKINIGDEAIKEQLLSDINAFIEFTPRDEEEQKEAFKERMSKIGEILDGLDEAVKGKQSGLDKHLRNVSAESIQAAVKGFLQRKKGGSHAKKSEAAIAIQKAYRAHRDYKESQEARSIAGELIRKIEALINNKDLREIDELKQDIHNYLSSDVIGFYDKSADIKNIVQEIMETKYPGKFKGDNISASFPTSIADIATENRNYIKAKIEEEVSSYRIAVRRCMGEAIEKPTEAAVTECFSALVRDYGSMTNTDISPENASYASFYSASQEDLNLPLRITLGDLSADNRAIFMHNSEKKTLEQLRFGIALATEANKSFAELPGASTVRAVNDIPHAIEDLLRGIDSEQKQRYFGSRSYIGLTRGARNNFFG